MKKIVLLLSLTLIFGVSSFAVQRDTVKVLAIGNSFSEDAVEEHLSSLAQAEGLTVVIGNMYIGGCSLERHVNNLRGNLPEYRYRKFDPKGNMKEINGYTLDKVLAEEDWDYISVHGSLSLWLMYVPWCLEQRSCSTRHGLMLRIPLTGPLSTMTRIR